MAQTGTQQRTAEREQQAREHVNKRVDLARELRDHGVPGDVAAQIIGDAYWLGWECGFDSGTDASKS